MNSQRWATTVRRMEKKIRRKYRRRIIIWVLLFLLAGMVCGVLMATRTSWFDPMRTDGVSGTAMTPALPVTTTTPEPVGDVGGLVLATPAPTPEVAPEATPAAAEPTATPEPEVQIAAQVEPVSTDSGAILDAVPPTVDATATPEPAAATQEPAAPEATPIPAVVVDPVKAGDSFTFTTQVFEDGSARETVSEADGTYDTISLTLAVRNYLLPDYFASKYADAYKLTGSEAGVAFDLTFDSSTLLGSIVPQNAFTITFENKKGDEVQGYQLMDAEIAGNYDVSLNMGSTKTFYKRFVYSEDIGDMSAMVVTAYMDGVPTKIRFLVEGATDAAAGDKAAANDTSYASLKKGDKSPDVETLQKKLIKLGYLTGTADGAFGAMTEEAVKAAQNHYGQEQTGVADDALLKLLYAE